VADAALERGAVETPDGERYCAPCAAKLGREPVADDDDVRIVMPQRAVALPVVPADEEPEVNLVFPEEPDPEPDPEPQSEPEPEPAAEARPETVRTAAGSGRRRARKSSRPSVRAGRRKSAKGASTRKGRARKGSERNKPRAGRKPSDRKKPRPKHSSARVKPGKRREAALFGEDSPTARRTSRRAGAAELPWYFKLNRGQWIGIAAGVGGLLIFLVIFGAWASYQPNPKEKIHHRRVAYGSEGSELLGQGVRLEQQGRKKEAIAAYRRAVDAANKVAEKARRNGDMGAARAADEVARQANMRLYAIMKHSTLNGH
jgi:hypothetical protein